LADIEQNIFNDHFALILKKPKMICPNLVGGKIFEVVLVENFVGEFSVYGQLTVGQCLHVMHIYNNMMAKLTI